MKKFVVLNFGQLNFDENLNYSFLAEKEKEVLSSNDPIFKISIPNSKGWLELESIVFKPRQGTSFNYTYVSGIVPFE